MNETRSKYLVSGSQHIPNENSLLPFSNICYRPPSPEDVRFVIKSLNLTGSQIGVIMGVDSRTVRKWVSPISASTRCKIPYSAWRLLLIYGRFVSNQYFT